ncbi:hypothetical protein NM96_12570 [Neisseria mucosa]|nr:hypothetical protein NM96_12570 [Neisseria mucosa]
MIAVIKKGRLKTWKQGFQTTFLYFQWKILGDRILAEMMVKDYIPSFPRRREYIGNARRRWVLKITHRNVGFARGLLLKKLGLLTHKVV